MVSMRRPEPRPSMNTTTSIASAIRPARHGDDRFLDELLEAVERRHRAELAWTVVMPPGWPVFQALSMSSASAPRTSPTMIRSGRKSQGRAHQVGQRGDAGLRAQGDAIVGRALQLARVLDQDDPVVARRHFRQQRIDERGLAGAGAADDDDVPALDTTACASAFGLKRRHDARRRHSR